MVTKSLQKYCHTICPCSFLWFAEAMVCTTAMSQSYFVHHWPALCTLNLQCAPWCRRGIYLLRSSLVGVTPTFFIFGGSHKTYSVHFLWVTWRLNPSSFIWWPRVDDTCMFGAWCICLISMNHGGYGQNLILIWCIGPRQRVWERVKREG